MERESSGPPPTAVVETTLISLISLGIRVSQGIGYFPLSIVKSKNGYKFAFNRCSFPLICSFSIIACQLFLIILWYSSFVDTMVLMGLHRSTEVISFIVTGTLIAFQTVFKRVSFIFKHQLVINRWGNFITDLTRISSSDKDGNFRISIDPCAKHCEIFTRVKTSVRNTVLGSMIFILVMMSQIVGGFLLFSIPAKRPNIQTGLNMMGIIPVVSWSVMGAVNVFQSLFVTFPIQVVNACLEMIDTEMGHVCGNVEDWEENLIIAETEKTVNLCKLGILNVRRRILINQHFLTGNDYRSSSSQSEPTNCRG